MTDHHATPPNAGPSHTRPPEFAAPGPGSWALDADHQSSTRSPLFVDLFLAGFVGGSRAAFARHGLPLDRLDGADVHGWFYVRPVPAGVPDRGGPPPPLPVLRILTRLVPELRRRERVARQAIAERRWVAEAHAWNAERHGWIERIDASIAADLAGATDGELARLTGDALSLARDLTFRHFDLLGMTIGIGRLVVAAPGFGLTATDVMTALRGSAPHTAASKALLVELAAIAADTGGVPDTTDELRGRSPRAAELTDEYLRVYGWRPLGNDPACTTLVEFPDQLVELVRAAGQQSATPAPTSDVVAAARARLADAERIRLDGLLDDARTCYGASDDNAGVLGWAIGALRRVALEVGGRATRRGELDRAPDVFLLLPDELVAAANGASPVTIDGVRARRERRRAADLTTPPSVLGDAPVPPPPPAAFPPAMAELAAVVGAYLGMKFTRQGPPPATDRSTLSIGDRPVVSGLGVVAGSVSGRVVVTADPQDALLRVEPGDILVCPYTSAAWNALFPILGGIVTGFGGPLGHTAVMAREFDLPCIVGIGALPHAADGATGTLHVELDG